MPTAVERLLEEFVTGGWDLIQSLPGDARPETMHLDFKLKEDPTTGRLGRGDRKTLSKALSGFANAEGGLLVWGVDARTVDGVDVVQDVQPISEIDVFESRCRTLLPEMVSPYIEATLHAILDEEDPSRGVLLMAVPESDSTPHMATGPDLHAYYRRSGASFRVMEHNEVADMFGRRPLPKLEVEIGLRVAVTGTGGGVLRGRLSLKFVLRNHGRGILRFPCLTLGRPEGWRIGSRVGFSAPVLHDFAAPGGWWMRRARGGDFVVYPEDEIDALELHFDLRENVTEFPDLAVAFDAVGAECPHVRGTVRVEAAAIQFGWQEALETRQVVQVPVAVTS